MEALLIAVIRLAENSPSPPISQGDDTPNGPTSDTGVDTRSAETRQSTSDSEQPAVRFILSLWDAGGQIGPIGRILILLLVATVCFITLLLMAYGIYTAAFDRFILTLESPLVSWASGFVYLVSYSGLPLSLAFLYFNKRRDSFIWAVSLVGVVTCGVIVSLHVSYFVSIASSDRWTDYCAYVRILDPPWLPPSQIGALPQTFQACEARVAPQQASLFTERIYWDQYPGFHHFFPNHTYHNTTFSKERFLAIRYNSTLCYPGKEARDLEAKGFQANEDLYGQGVRIGIYLNWIASLLANQLLATKRRRAIQKAYLLTFNTILCMATYFEILRPCVFGIEIVVLYWAYWGGALCVFSSAPNESRLSNNPRWTQLDWITAVRYTSNGLMVYHGFWFTLYGYNYSYARMPCGTYHFMFWRLLDPSPWFCIVWTSVTGIMTVFVVPVAIGIPLVAVLLASEIKVYISQALIYRNSDSLGPYQHLEDSRPNRSPQNSFVSKILRLLRLLRRCKRWHGRMREMFGLPFHAQPGIRLVTPLDKKNRKKYRVHCAALWFTSFTLSVTGIETTLRWNNVDNINSFNSTGQYLALPLGLFVVIDVVAKLWQQEKERRRQLLCRQVVGEEVELEDFTVVRALQHAAAQPDNEFLMSGGLGLNEPTVSTP